MKAHSFLAVMIAQERQAMLLSATRWIGALLLVLLLLWASSARAIPVQAHSHSPCTYRATFIADATIPDNTVLAPGKTLGIDSFTVVPTTTRTLHEPLTLAWSAHGEHIELCPLTGAGPVACQPIPPTGQQVVVTDQTMLEYVGFFLRATVGRQQTTAIVQVQFQCQGWRDWFFASPPKRCPSAAPRHSPAAAQHFEHGWMIWTKEPDQFYIFFDDGQFILTNAPYRFGADQPVSEAPPGRYAPVSGFGKVWRGAIELATTENIRQRLGWATEPEFAFESSYQCETPAHPQLWRCYLRGPDGAVYALQPDSSAQVHLLWSRYAQ